MRPLGADVSTLPGRRSPGFRNRNIPIHVQASLPKSDIEGLRVPAARRLARTLEKWIPRGLGVIGQRVLMVNSSGFTSRLAFEFPIGRLGLDSAFSKYTDPDSPCSDELRASLDRGGEISRGILPGNQASPVSPDNASPPRG